MSQDHRRMRVLKLALRSLLASAALLASPRLAQRVYAQTGGSTCEVNCSRGSCSGTGTCTCSCSFWTGVPICSCQAEEEQPVPPPSQP